MKYINKRTIIFIACCIVWFSFFFYLGIKSSKTHTGFKKSPEQEWCESKGGYFMSGGFTASNCVFPPDVTK